MENNIWFNLCAIFLSGLAGVVLTIFVQRKTRKIDLKYELLMKFTENRFDLSGIDFTKAINKIYIVFGKNDNVISTLKDFHRAIIEKSTVGPETNRKLRSIYVAMCKDLKIDPMSEELFLVPFNVKKS